jgi:FkbM family methyltransferase
MSTDLATYLKARLKLAFGRGMAAFGDTAFLRTLPSLRLVRIGTEYGGWYCCGDLLGPGKVAMCCGAGEDVSFDVALNSKCGMRILCVDPTPRSVSHVGSLLAAVRNGGAMPIEAGPSSYDLTGFRESDFTFVDCAVWSSDGYLELFAPKDPAHVSYSAVNLQHTSETIRVRSRTMGSLLDEFGIARLALLKLDIEGAEYEVLRSMIRMRALPEQLLVEFDQINQPLSMFFWIELYGILRALREAGYRLVHRERANYSFVLASALER